MSGISAHGTVSFICVAEGLRLIFTSGAVEDDEEIRDDEGTAEQVVKDIRRAARKLHSSEAKIRRVLSDLCGEYRIVELCRKGGTARSLHYSWLHVPRDGGHRFHGMMGTDSAASRAVIPRDRGQV